MLLYINFKEGQLILNFCDIKSFSAMPYLLKSKTKFFVCSTRGGKAPWLRFEFQLRGEGQWLLLQL